MAVVADRVIVELEAKLDRYEANVRRAEAKFDSATRAMVKMEDGLARVRVAIGKAALAFVDLGVAIGNAAGKLFGGELAPDTGTGGRADAYADAFRRVRGTYTVGGAKTGGRIGKYGGVGGMFVSIGKWISGN